MKPYPITRFSKRKGLLIVNPSRINLYPTKGVMEKKEPCKKETESMGSKQVDCTICLDPILETDNMGCGSHPICKECITSLSGDLCPTCKKKIKKNKNNKQILKDCKLRKNLDKILNSRGDNFLVYYQQNHDDDKDWIVMKDFFVNKLHILAPIYMDEVEGLEQILETIEDYDEDDLSNFYNFIISYWDHLEEELMKNHIKEDDSDDDHMSTDQDYSPSDDLYTETSPIIYATSDEDMN